MAELRAKDVDRELRDRAHIAARFCKKSYTQFIVTAVDRAVTSVECEMANNRRFKDAAKRRKGEQS